MAKVVLLTAVLSLIAIQLSSRSAQGLWPASAAVLLLVIFAAAVAFGPSRGAGKRLRALGIVGILTVFPVMYHVNVFSPVGMALFVGVYFVGLGDSKGYSWTMFLLATGGYLTMGLAATVGWISLENALLPLTDLRPIATFSLTAITCVLLGLTFWIARRSRKATLAAMSELERAERQISNRDALLDEARADLNRALDAAKVGRYSGERVGSYLCGEIIGRGAMAEIYLAHAGENGASVAVKVLHRHVLDDSEQVQRFFREAALSQQIDSPYVAKVLGSGCTEDGSPYLVLEYLVGHDLARELHTKGYLELDEVARMIEQVALALAAAHELGIVHRDLKPQNIFVTEGEGGRLYKVVDFGACTIRNSTSSLTQGFAVGTPSYMAPEQALGGDVDQRADVFSLGTIAYRALTGRPAFTDGDSVTTMYNVVHVQPVRPTELRSMAEDVDLALAIALAKDPASRFQSVQFLSGALSAAIAGRLTDELRSTARQLLALQPWGSELAARQDAS